MAIGFKHGASGSGMLGITIVPGTTRPTDPKENTIWANSSYGMRRWSVSPSHPMIESWQKNLIVYPYYETTHTEDGVTFTDNKDGTITANGTATAESNFRFSHQSAQDGMFLLRPGTYTLSGCPTGGGNSTYMLVLTRLNDSGSWEVWRTEGGSGNTFTATKEWLCCLLFRVYKGAKVEDLTVRPQLEAGSAATSWIMGNATGQVWIKTADSGDVTMNAIKGKNEVAFKPVAVYEYTTGSRWKKRDAEVYQNGAWKALEDPSAPVTPDASWDGYYFNNGNQYTGITGGWSTNGWVNSGTVSVGDTIVASTAPEKYARVGTVNAVDISSVKKLWFDSPSGNNGYNPGYLAVTSQKTGDDFAAIVAITAGRGSLDVSNLSGQYYICLYVGPSAYADISAIWKE